MTVATPPVLGADGFPGGWVVAEVPGSAGPGRSPVRWHAVADAAGLLALADRVGAAVLAADVPIGLPDRGTRRCDVEARRRLSGGRASSVFAAPHRPALAFTRYADARADLPSLSAQSFALVARIRDVDTALRAAGPGVHDRVVECHPEVSLRALTGRVLPRKKSAAGALLRLQALTAALGEVPPDAPAQAGLDDALDALACAWTARRFLAGTAEVLGGDPDGTGAPMRIVV